MFYKHFTSEERNELSVLLRAGLKQCKIAKQLGKSPGAVSGEIKRSSTNGKYDARYAKVKVRERRVSANERFRKLEHNPWLRSYIVRKLKKHWSPEQIEGRLKKEYPCSREKQIGKDSIYKYIHNERKDLAKYLRCKKGRYRRRYGTRIREKQREEEKKKRIDRRPPIVETKERIGDWEGDTIVKRKISISSPMWKEEAGISLRISWRGLRQR